MRLLWEQVKGRGMLLSCMLLAGCLRPQQVPPLAPQAKTPNIYVPPPSDAKLPPMQTDDTPAKLTDAKPVEAAEVKPRKKPKRQPPPATPPVVVPPTVAPPSEAPPPASPATLGDLAPGGGTATPKQQQEVMVKIGAVDKRISEVPAATADREQKQIAKVRQFLGEATDALKGGDVEGAAILATKADLLMDDLVK